MADASNADAGTITSAAAPGSSAAVATTGNGAGSSSRTATAVGAAAQYLPWGAVKEKSQFPANMQLRSDSKPGQFVMQVLFAEFTVMADRKIEQVLQHCINNKESEKPLAKLLQRGEDAQFDQLLTSLNDVAELCLPALLRALFDWYDKQNPTDELGNILHRHGRRQQTATLESKDVLCEKRDLAVDFIYCLVLIEVLKQLPYHPGHDEHITHILSQCFKHFKYKEEIKNSPAPANYNMIADLYAEVLGVLSRSRFPAVKKRFLTELKEMRAKDPAQPHITNSVVSLLMGVKFFRVKMHPLEEFVQCMSFLQELGNYFLDTKVKGEVIIALAGLFVEILLPLAGMVKNEVNVPVLKNFVEKMYIPTLEMASRKKKFCMALFPMVTCLLCVSQKNFFLEQWPTFLQQCLSRLRGEPKMARVALESLYRLVWVYMIRIKCEGNTQTISRLQSIVNSLFPKGQKNSIIPKEAPLMIFVKIIQYIAQERLDFAMRDIIYELLSVGKPKIYSPERVSIGLRAFLVIADSLQQREGEPPMPLTMSVLPSGFTLRGKKTFISKYLSEETARTIGVLSYYANVRKAFDAILRNLDGQVGRPLLQTKPENLNRDAQELITGERKPKMDLFRTCVASIPRLLPDGMNQYELIDLLARLTLHIDDELGKLAFQSLQNMMGDLAHWRTEVVLGFVQFVQREAGDQLPAALLEVCTWRLVSLLGTWRAAEQSSRPAPQNREPERAGTAPGRHSPSPLPPSSAYSGSGSGSDTATRAKETKAASLRQGAARATLHAVEGLALVLLCSCRPSLRKRAVTILRDVRTLFNILGIPADGDPVLLDIMDKSCPQIIEKVLPSLPEPERTTLQQTFPIDFQWLADRTSIILLDLNEQLNHAESPGSEPSGPSAAPDPWATCISVFMNPDFVLGQCPTAVSHAWPLLFQRLQALWPQVDPQVVIDASRTSILPGRVNKRPPNERDMYMNLWKNYVIMGCCIVPPSAPRDAYRPTSPDMNLPSPEQDRSEGRGGGAVVASGAPSADKLFKLLVPLIKCDVADMRESVIMGLGHINPAAFRDAVEELTPLIKEAIERKKGNREKIRRRDVLRLALARILHYIAAETLVFTKSQLEVLEPQTESLSAAFVEYLDGARQYLESDVEKDPQVLHEIRLHFAHFTRHLIRTMPVSRRKKLLSKQLRLNLFNLFALWSGKLGYPFVNTDKKPASTRDGLLYSELELVSVQAMAGVLTCGPVWGSPPGLATDSKVYVWLNNMLGSHHEKLYQLAQETVVWLLEFNPDTQCLLEWVIDRCYIAPPEVADGCFLALARVFSQREYSCDHEAMLCLTLLNSGSPRIHVHETAVQLLHLLYKRFFLDDVIPHDQSVAMETSAVGATGNVAGAAETSPGPAAGAGTTENGESTLLWHSSQSLSRSKLQQMLLSGPYSRSQYCLSETLARLHPEETMLVFSEITKRMNSATAAVRQSLLQLLLPWLHNLELCDPNLQNPASTANPPESGLQSDYESPPLRGEGWGSPEATQMVLNNLFFVSARLGDDHSSELADMWTAMVACWPDNIRCILRYIVIVTGMAPELVLPHARRIIVYLGRAKPERLVDEMMNELRTIEALTFNVERTQTPPYFRLSVKRAPASPAGSGHCSPEDSLSAMTDNTDVVSLHESLAGSKPSSAAGSITSAHRLRLSLEYPPADRLMAPSPVTDSEASTATTGATSVHEDEDSAHTGATGCTQGEGGTQAGGSPQQKGTSSRSEALHAPFPLPMPPYGGYFAPMHELLASDTASLPNPPYQRCNLAIMLLTDLVVDSTGIDWIVHLPLILHLVFLGMDNPRPLIHEHCKKLLLNLLLVLSAHNDHFSVAKIILGSKDVGEDPALTLSGAAAHSNRDSLFMETSYESGTYGGASGSPSGAGEAAGAVDCVGSLAEVSSYESTEQVAKALIEFLVTRKSQPLWACEEITARVHSIASARQLERLLQYVLRIFRTSLPHAHIEQRWGQEALHLALNCSSRHYAGRAFQVFRALRVPLTCRDLCEILARLEQTVAESDENMQGYVAEMLLTLQHSVDNLDNSGALWATSGAGEEGRSGAQLLANKDIYMSTPNLNKDTLAQLRKSVTSSQVRQFAGSPGGQHTRSTSYSPGTLARRHVLSVAPALIPEKVDEGPGRFKILLRNPRRTRRIVSTPPGMVETKLGSRGHHHSFSDSDPMRKSPGDGSLRRSASTQSLKQPDPSVHEDKVTILTQMFWIAVALLESDYDYEFFMAVKLLTKILAQLEGEQLEVNDRLEKIVRHVAWHGFPGVQALLTKGCTHANTAEPTWRLLSKLTGCLSLRVIAPDDSDGFPLNVIALLPYLVLHYEEPSELCVEAAERIAEACKDMDELHNLKHMMLLYSRGTFGKQSDQWTKCVVKYLYDAYVDSSEVLLAFLVEVLDKGPVLTQGPVLQILHCIVSYYLDQDQLPMQNMNSVLLTVVAKFIESTHWKKSMEILKLCVSKSSALAAAPNDFHAANPADNFGLHTFNTQFSDAAELAKKQLPGRTMDFKFNMKQVSVIGHKRLNLPNNDLEDGAKGGGGEEAGYVTCWEKPRLCQEHVRQRLRRLLEYYDPTPRAHKLHNSSSVTFPFEDSPGNTLERQLSVNNTSNPSDGGSVVDTQTGTDPSETITGDDSSVNKALQSFHFLEEEDFELTGGFSFGVMDRGAAGGATQDEAESESDSDSFDETETGFLPELTHVTLENPQVEADRSRSRNPSGSTQYSGVQVTDTEDEVTDLSPCNASPSNAEAAPHSLLQRHAPPDEAEEEWRSHVMDLMQSGGGDSTEGGTTVSRRAVHSFHIFTRLFQHTSAALSALTTECCSLLQRPAYIQEIAAQISHMLELMITRLVCPFVFVDAQALWWLRLLELHKLCYAEIEQTYDTYCKKRRDVIECLHHVRAASKSGPASADQHLDPVDRMKLLLCERLYGLHFQFLQLYECYDKLVQKLAVKHPQVIDLGREVDHLKQEVRRAQTYDLDLDPDTVEGGASGYDVANISQSEAEHMVVDMLNKHNYSGVLSAVPHLKPVLLEEVRFSDDVDVVLYVYCKKQSDLKPGVVAVSSVEHESVVVKQCLTAVYTALKHGDQALRAVELLDVPGAVVTRTTDFSIL